jgi:hypothetical protein
MITWLTWLTYAVYHKHCHLFNKSQSSEALYGHQDCALLSASMSIGLARLRYKGLNFSELLNRAEADIREAGTALQKQHDNYCTLIQDICEHAAEMLQESPALGCEYAEWQARIAMMTRSANISDEHYTRLKRYNDRIKRVWAVDAYELLPTYCYDISKPLSKNSMAQLAQLADLVPQTDVARQYLIENFQQAKKLTTAIKITLARVESPKTIETLPHGGKKIRPKKKQGVSTADSNTRHLLKKSPILDAPDEQSQMGAEVTIYSEEPERFEPSVEMGRGIDVASWRSDTSMAMIDRRPGEPCGTLAGGNSSTEESEFQFGLSSSAR